MKSTRSSNPLHPAWSMNICTMIYRHIWVCIGDTNSTTYLLHKSSLSQTTFFHFDPLTCVSWTWFHHHIPYTTLVYVLEDKPCHMSLMHPIANVVEGVLFHLYYCWNVVSTWDSRGIIDCRNDMWHCTRRFVLIIYIWKKKARVHCRN
jgi:hypothetical protein